MTSAHSGTDCESNIVSQPGSQALRGSHTVKLRTHTLEVSQNVSYRAKFLVNVTVLLRWCHRCALVQQLRCGCYCDWVQSFPANTGHFTPGPYVRDVICVHVFVTMVRCVEAGDQRRSLARASSEHAERTVTCCDV